MPLNEGAVNEILPIASAADPETGVLMPLAEYQAHAGRTLGHQPGLASAELINRNLRQVSLMAAGLAQFIANRYGPGVVDNADLDAIEAGLLQALQAAIAPTVATAIAANAVAPATTTARGVAELATDAECVAGADTQRIVTPAGLLAALLEAMPGNATTEARGLVELATGAECVAGVDTTRAAAPQGVAAAIAAWAGRSPGHHHGEGPHQARHGGRVRGGRRNPRGRDAVRSDCLGNRSPRHHHGQGADPPRHGGRVRGRRRNRYCRAARRAAGGFLRANLDRAARHRLRQYRYIFFLKPSARRDLRMRPRPYPKPGVDTARLRDPDPPSGR